MTRTLALDLLYIQYFSYHLDGKQAYDTFDDQLMSWSVVVNSAYLRALAILLSTILLLYKSEKYYLTDLSIFIKCVHLNIFKVYFNFTEHIVY